MITLGFIRKPNRNGLGFPEHYEDKNSQDKSPICRKKNCHGGVVACLENGWDAGEVHILGTFYLNN